MQLCNWYYWQDTNITINIHYDQIIKHSVLYSNVYYFNVISIGYIFNAK